MQNQNFYSGMNPETIHNLSIKLREANKDHEKLLYFLNEISKYLSKVELINRELNDYEHLFEISNKAPGTIEFFFFSMSAALYLLLKLSLYPFNSYFFKKNESLHLLFI